MERHWQSLDMSVSKLVIDEGDLGKECGFFGAEIELLIEEIDLDQVDFDSIYFQDESKNIAMKIGRAFTEFDIAFEEAASSMYPGEKSRFDVVGENWKSVHFVASRVDESSEFSNKLEFAQENYEKAVELIRQRNYKGAFKLFRQASILAIIAKDEELKLKSLSNMTLCQKHLNNHEHVVNGVKVILDKNESASNKSKLLHRKALSEMKLQNYEVAIIDLNQALILDPENKSYQNDLKQAKVLLKNHENKLGNAMKKMFN